MKKIKLLILLCIIIQFAKAQDDQFFVFDKEWKPVDIKKAVYLLRVSHANDSSWEWTYYNFNGPRIKVENFKDQKATVKNGKFYYYHETGFIDSSGNFADGEIDGDWYYGNTIGLMTGKKTFQKGILIFDTTYSNNKKDTANKYKLLPGEVESEYPGGLNGWAYYLNKNLHYPDRAMNIDAQGEVRLQFVVDNDGGILNPEINKSVEYSLDEEALRIIKNSKKWTPAIKDGRNVKSYKIQPIDFKLVSE